ncbi:MAG: sulfatase/phosphatase domain-containing protein, partial [Chloroflexota bacterium]
EDDTVVIFTTDHGEMMGSHRLISKTNFYEESAKTITLIKQPHKIAARSVDHTTFIGTIDLMPTMLDLCEIEVPKGLDGKSYKATCYAQDESLSDFSELFAINPDGRMLRFGQYKYVHSVVYGQEYEILFDLEADPNETKNLFNTVGYEDVSLSARKRLNDWLTRENLGLNFQPI